MGGGNISGTNAPSNQALNAALSRLGSDPNANMVEPGSGGAAYWYVDPRAQTAQQMQAAYDENEGHEDGYTTGSMGYPSGLQQGSADGDTGNQFDIEAALSRMQNSAPQNISF